MAYDKHPTSYSKHPGSVSQHYATIAKHPTSYNNHPASPGGGVNTHNVIGVGASVANVIAINNANSDIQVGA